MDIPIEHAMLCWNSGFRGATPSFKVVLHPDYRGASDLYQSSVGACLASWGKLDSVGRRLQLMVDAWHIVAFYEVPVEMVQQGLLVIPEYRDMLADDCLPRQFQHERN